MVVRILLKVERNNEVIGKRILIFPELEDVPLDAEYAMNNRPLCYQGEEYEHQDITLKCSGEGKTRNTSRRRLREANTRQSNCI